jgi:hypothetical protein
MLPPLETNSQTGANLAVYFNRVQVCFNAKIGVQVFVWRINCSNQRQRGIVLCCFPDIAGNANINQDSLLLSNVVGNRSRDAPGNMTTRISKGKHLISVCRETNIVMECHQR